MKNIQKIGSVAVALACAFSCGAWGRALDADVDDGDERYVGGELISLYATETVSYTSRSVRENIQTANGMPSYTDNNSAHTNACGALAGANAVGFYDRYYHNMIAGWDSFITGFAYRSGDSTYVPATIDSLYTLMQTNVSGAGVSKNEFQAGLTQYGSNNGYTISHSLIGKRGMFNYATFKTAVKNNKVTALFLSPSNVYNITPYDGYDVITSSAISGKHIMIAYGYCEIQYIVNGSLRADQYLRVTTGLDNSYSYYKVDTQLDSAYVIEVA